MATFKCTAAGDSMVFRRFPGEYEGFSELKNFIAKGDFRFFNLETTVHDFETGGAALSGGSWFCTEPAVLHDMHRFGFNVTTPANNHALDYGIEGLRMTLANIKKEDFVTAGTGESLAKAAAPGYLDTVGARYALIACNTSFTPDCMAGEQTKTMPGRPGMNGVRVKTTYRVLPEQLEVLKTVAAETGINGADDISRREGYLPPLAEDVAALGSLRFQVGDKPGVDQQIDPNDLSRLTEAVKEAKYFADYAVVSVHSHQIKATVKEEPAAFFEDLCHALIDAGADAVIGTGPHLLRPIEIYKGKPIFYSLGDFILENETMKFVPSGMYEKQGLTGNEPMSEMYENRSDHGKKGLYYTRVMFEAVVPYWEETDGKLTEISLLPIELGYRKPRSIGGLPTPCFDRGILERLAEMSKPYGTEITIDRDGIGHIKLN